MNEVIIRCAAKRTFDTGDLWYRDLHNYIDPTNSIPINYQEQAKNYRCNVFWCINRFIGNGVTQQNCIQLD